MASIVARFRPIELDDNPRIAEIIRECLQEFGAVGDGFAWSDPEVDAMFEAYQGEGLTYLVVLENGVPVGGGGIGRLAGGDDRTCELQKMYFTKSARGKGYGEKLLRELLEFARNQGNKKIYLETLKHMDAANGLYRKLGFEPLQEPMGNTGHCGCDFWYAMDL